MTNNKPERNWQLIVAGILLILFGAVCAFFPGLTLASIAFMVGAAFIVSGVVDIMTYSRDRFLLPMSGWLLVYGILDVLIGIMFVVHPFAFAAVLPWLIGAFTVAFGVYEIAAAVRARTAQLPMWGWTLFSGIVTLLIGISFFVMPEMLALFIALFAVMHGVSLIVLGANSYRFL